MNIGIIGSGNIGGTLAELLARRGHSIEIANSRGPGTLKALEHQLGAGARAATVEQAAAFGEVVVVAIPFHAIDALPPAQLAGTIVLDAGNYYPGRDGHVAALDSDATTSSELLAELLPGARVIKAFNTMQAATLGAAGDPAAPFDERLAIFAAGDDEAAKATVLELIDELGFAPVDTGGLADGGRLQQPGSPVYGANVTGGQASSALRR